ncbi:MAG: hypothetical protein IID53_05950 [Proteobacteria bacterium]|nr:hypothetical protein [Pseudomonadota bacterium]
MKEAGNTHERVYAERAVKGSSDRTLGLVFAVIFLIVGLAPLAGGAGVRIWALILAAVFVVLAIAWPASLGPLNRIWTKFGLLLHKFMSPLVMGVIFYLSVTPIGVFLRVIGKTTLGLRPDPKMETYWIERRPPGPPPETMKNQF